MKFPTGQLHLNNFPSWQLGNCLELSGFESELHPSKASIASGDHCQPIIRAATIFYVFSLALCYWVIKLKWTFPQPSALAAEYLNNYFKHVYLKCDNVPISYKVNIQWQLGNSTNMFKMTVNGGPSNLLSKVPQVLKRPSALSLRVPWLSKFFEFRERQRAKCLEW